MRPAVVLERNAALAIRVLLIGLLATGAIYTFRALQPIVLPFMFALLLTALLSPAVDWLGQRMRRGFAVALIIAGFLLFIFGTLAYIIPTLVGQASDAVQQVEGGLEKLPDVASSFGLNAKETQELIASLTQRLRENLGGISSAVSSSALTIASATIAAAFGAFLTFVLLVYLLIDGRAFWAGGVRLIDADRRAGVMASGLRAWKALVVFIRSQVVVAAIDAVGMALGLFIFGVPLILPLAVLTFILSFIPYIGATLSGLIVALVALSTQGVGAMVGVLVVAGIVQFLEGNLVYPLLVGRSLRLHPITVLLAIGVGSAILGILGAFFATPVLATAAAAAGLLPDFDTGEPSAVVQEADAPPPDAALSPRVRCSAKPATMPSYAEPSPRIPRSDHRAQPGLGRVVQLRGPAHRPGAPHGCGVLHGLSHRRVCCARAQHR
ncbi:MAG: AI-2E family transporter [Solirubrobacteraceae bacterium]|nr:AI-2E family transporter [Solirubrobacteraceae bacterium]